MCGERDGVGGEAGRPRQDRPRQGHSVPTGQRGLCSLVRARQGRCVERRDREVGGRRGGQQGYGCKGKPADHEGLLQGVGVGARRSAHPRPLCKGGVAKGDQASEGVLSHDAPPHPPHLSLLHSARNLNLHPPAAGERHATIARWSVWRTSRFGWPSLGAGFPHRTRAARLPWSYSMYVHTGVIHGPAGWSASRRALPGRRHAPPPQTPTRPRAVGGQVRRSGEAAYLLPQSPFCPCSRVPAGCARRLSRRRAWTRAATRAAQHPQ